MTSQDLATNKPAWLKDIDVRCRNMAKLAEERESAEIIQLPLWHEGKCGSPNTFLRSALFAAIQSKDRVYLEAFPQGNALPQNERNTVSDQS